MKAQSEILVFILLFLLSISLFITAIFWSKDTFQKNVDTAKVSSAEKLAKELDSGIKNIIKFDGYEEIDYIVDGPIILINENTIEVRAVISSDISIPKYWSNISSDASYIREMLDGDIFRIQIIYPESYQKVILFTEGPTLAKPKSVKIEKNYTSIENGKPSIKIRITFV
jgi:hypothetical protein